MSAVDSSSPGKITISQHPTRNLAPNCRIPLPIYGNVRLVPGSEPSRALRFQRKNRDSDTSDAAAAPRRRRLTLCGKLLLTLASLLVLEVAVRGLLAYDAMTSDRPYHGAMTSPEALAEIEVNADKQFDPDLAKLFFTIVRESEPAQTVAAGASTEQEAHAN